MAPATQRHALLLGAVLIGVAAALAVLTLVFRQSPLTSANDAGIDDVFVARMLEMDAETSEIARLADTHAEHQELRLLAKEIVRSMERDGALMGSWRVWRASPLLQPAGQRETDRHAVVTAPIFDKAFIEVMMARYERGIEWCRRALRSGRDGRIHLLASDLIASRARELVLMRLYYGWWYDSSSAR